MTDSTASTADKGHPDTVSHIHVSIVVYSLLVVISAVYLVKDSGYPALPLSDPGQGLFPYIVGGILVTGAAGGLVRSVRLACKKNVGIDRSVATGQASTWLRPAVFFGTCVLYVTSIGYIGFLLSTVIFLLVVIFAMGERRPVRALLYAGAIACASSLLFHGVLHIPLPNGIFGV